MPRALLALGTAACLALAAAPADRAPQKIDIAPGVFLFKTPPYGAVGLDGNSVVIVGDGGVLVFDSNGTPAAASAVLAEIRKITDRPVRYLVNSHWHWDHWYGSQVYTEAYPNLHVVAHEATRAMMAGPAIEFNRPGIETQLPRYIESLRARLTSLERSDRANPDVARVRASLDEATFFLEQKRSVRPVLPDVTYSDRLTLHLGSRVIQVLHYERAVTPGDTFLYLPAEKILVTGDLLVNPVSFALSCYPTGWLRTLEKLDALPTSAIVPGHGDPLPDHDLLRATMDVMRELLRGGADAKARGLDADAARDEIFPRLRPAMVRITRDDPALNEAFRVQMVDWYLHRVYDELDGKLTDAIAPIPVR